MHVWGIALLLVVGCYRPTVQAGSPCDDTHLCPGSLVCSPATQTCETTSTEVDASPMVVDAPHLIDGCTPVPEICGDSIDQDCDGIDPPCPSNDKAAGAIDIGAGGTFTGDLKFATDDAGKPNGSAMFCGNSGGRDLFYKIHLDADEAIYLDTFTSNFDTVIRVFHGTCKDGTPPSSTECHNDACAGSQTQGIWDLNAGDNCVVVDQFSSAETKGSLVLHVERGGRTGSPINLGTAVVSTTTGKTDQSTPPCDTVAGPDVGYYFMECPASSDTFVASTCNATTAGANWDPALYIKGPGINSLMKCNDDDPTPCALDGNMSLTPPATASGPHMFWVIIDSGFANDSGNFQIDTTVM